jgi:hypothetical protein
MRAIKSGSFDKSRAAMREHLSWTADLKLDDEEAAT